MENYLQKMPGAGLLHEYGIDVEATPDALAEMATMLGNRPTGEAMLLIAERGRKYGVRLFASPRFDAVSFVQDAPRFGMNQQQARRVALNLMRR